MKHLIKFHASKYDEDECSNLLENNLFVDNFFVTGNELEKLQNLYAESHSRMTERGFILRSWN